MCDRRKKRKRQKKFQAIFQTGAVFDNILVVWLVTNLYGRTKMAKRRVPYSARPISFQCFWLFLSFRHSVIIYYAVVFLVILAADAPVCHEFVASNRTHPMDIYARL